MYMKSKLAAWRWSKATTAISIAKQCENIREVVRIKKKNSSSK